MPYTRDEWKTMSRYSTLRTSAADTTRVECKEFAFHHAGYTSELRNMAMFRLRGSRAYKGGLRMANVLMLLPNVVESSTLPKRRFSHTRGKDLEEFRRDGYFIDHTDYYVHGARLDNPSDVLYEFHVISASNFGATIWRRLHTGMRMEVRASA
jgi:hypothetical protein